VRNRYQRQDHKSNHKFEVDHPSTEVVSVIRILRELTWFQGWPPTRAAGGANDYKAASPIWRGVMWSSIAQALTRERLVKRRRWP
jgi:hypothetical protein